GTDRKACFRAPCVRRGIRREKARQTEGHRHEDGMDQPTRLDSYRRQEAGRLRRRMDDRSRHAKYAAAPRFHEGFTEGWNGSDGRWISVERWVASCQRPRYYLAERPGLVLRVVIARCTR